MGFLRRRPLFVFGASALLAAMAVLSTTAAAVWRSAHTDEASRIGHVDVIAVLGAAQYAGRPSPTFEGRLRHAALLYRKGFSSEILVLGGGRPGDVTTEAEAGRSWLVSTEQLPQAAVHASGAGVTTLESLEAAAAWMRGRGLRSAFLVSDPWHNLRIRRIGRDLGIEAYVSATFRSAARSQETRVSGYAREVFAYLAYRVLAR